VNEEKPDILQRRHQKGTEPQGYRATKKILKLLNLPRGPELGTFVNGLWGKKKREPGSRDIMKKVSTKSTTVSGAKKKLRKTGATVTWLENNRGAHTVTKKRG